MTKFRAIIHIAGAPDPDGRQRCLLCRFVLQDNSPGMWVVAEQTDASRKPNWWEIGAPVTQIGSGPISQLWRGDNQGANYAHIRCSKFAEGMEEEFGFQLHPGDWLFEESIAAGDPRCLCSRCHKPILEVDVPIRLFVPGLRDREYRFHPKCLGAIT